MSAELAIGGSDPTTGKVYGVVLIPSRISGRAASHSDRYPTNPQLRLLPPGVDPASVVTVDSPAVGQVAAWDGSGWVPVTLALSDDAAAQIATPTIPATDGAPADTPTANTMRFDPATATLYVFDGAAWKSTVLT